MKETRISMLSFQMSLTGMVITSIGLVTPRLTEAFSLTVSQQGLIVSMQFIGASLSCLISGMFCEKYGSSFITRITLLIGIVTMLLFSLIQNYPMALLCVFLAGAFSLSMETSLVSSGMAIKGKEHIANAIIQTSFTFGAILVPLIFLLFGLRDEWRPVYITIAACLLLSLLISRGSREKTASKGLIQSLKSYPRYFTKGRYMLGAIVIFLYLAAEIGLWSLAPTLLESTGSGRLSGIISACLIWVMMLIGRLIGTSLMRRFDMIRILLPFGVLGIAAYTMIMFTSGPAAVVCIALVGFACAPFYAFLISWATIVANDKSSSYLGFIMAFGSFGPVVLGWVISLLGDAVAGRLIVLPAVCSFSIMMILLCVFGLRRYPRNKNMSKE
ncbi:MAG: MFS transporter [Treponema sp.]|jgi:fucose permease|nr:MFS transporter [Treponema sp.]